MTKKKERRKRNKQDEERKSKATRKDRDRVGIMKKGEEKRRNKVKGKITMWDEER